MTSAREPYGALSSELMEPSRRLAEYLQSVGSVITTYTGSYSSPARFLSILMSNLRSKVATFHYTPQELTYYVAPYSQEETPGVVIFNSPDGLTALNILLDQLRWTGYRLFLVTSTELPRQLKYKVREENLVVLGEDELWLFKTHLLVGLAVAHLSGKKGVRSERLWRELTELEGVFPDLIKHYEAQLEELKDFMSSPHLITSSPTMWGVAEYLAFSRRIRAQRFLVRPNEVRNYIRFINRVLVITTDVEEYSMKELKGLVLTASTDVRELKVSTDPLTAPIYGLMVGMALEERLSK